MPSGAPIALTRWLGSKRWLVTGHPHLLPLPKRGGRAFDCFAGSCVVAFWYLAQDRVVIGDTNARLIGCLRNLQERAVEVITALADLVADYSADIDPRGYFYAARDQLNQCRPETVEASALFLFILRVGFNGLYRENASGLCNTPWGEPKDRSKPSFLRQDLVSADELRAISALLTRADIRLGDFAETSADACVRDVGFFDAPYVVAGKFTGYSKRGFTLKDRQRLAMHLRELDRRGVRWTATDAATDHTLATYGLWLVDCVDVRRSVAAKGEARGTAQEVLVRNWRAEREAA